GTSDFAVERFLPDGTLDNSFGAHGESLIDFGMTETDPAFPPDAYPRLAYAYAMALQPDGKIVIAGSAADLYYSGLNVGFTLDFGALARLDAYGQLDTSFGADGKVSDLPQFQFVTSIALQPDDKIVALGNRRGTGGILSRFNPDGTPDSA